MAIKNIFTLIFPVFAIKAIFFKSQSKISPTAPKKHRLPNKNEAMLTKSKGDKMWWIGFLKQVSSFYKLVVTVLEKWMETNSCLEGRKAIWALEAGRQKVCVIYS